MRYFELFGLPGAGKTSLLRGWDAGTGALTIYQLIRRERLRSASTHHRASVLRYLPTSVKLRLLRGPLPDPHDTARFIVEHPQLHDLGVAVARQVPDEEDRAVALGLLLEAFARRAYAGRVAEAEEAVILDEGIWQRLAFLLALHGLGGHATPAVLPEAAAIDGLVILRVPLDRAIERVRSRQAEFQATDVMPEMARCLDLIEEHLRGCGVPIIVVDPERPKRESLAQVNSFIDEQLRGQ